MKKKARKRLPRPLYRGNARQRGVLSKTLQKGKKGGEETQSTTRKNNQPTKKKKKTCARSFSTGEENTVGQIERYVTRITHTSTKGHRARTHTPRPRRRAPGRHNHRTTTTHHQKHRHHKHATHNTARPPCTPTHTSNRHNKGHPSPRNTPPQPADPSQEWRGATHHHPQRNPARSGGE